MILILLETDKREDFPYLLKNKEGLLSADMYKVRRDVIYKSEIVLAQHDGMMYLLESRWVNAVTYQLLETIGINMDRVSF